MDTEELTPAERRLWRAFPLGAEVDLRQDDDDPEQGGDWGPERTVRAKVIRALLLSSPSNDGEFAALRLVGARITGLLDLRYGIVAHPIRIMACHFEQTAKLYGAQARQLNLSESYLPGLTAATIRVDGVLRLTGCRIPGGVRLGGAQISGALFIDHAHLGGGHGDALQLNQASIGDDLLAARLETTGRLRLDGARISGALNLEDAKLINDGGVSLEGDNVSIGAGFDGRGLHSHGEIRLSGARIEASLKLDATRLANPGGNALLCDAVSVGLNVICNDAEVVGHVRFSGARVQGMLKLRDAKLTNAEGMALDASSVNVGTDLNAAGLTTQGMVRLTGAKITGQLTLERSRLSNPAGIALGVSRCEAEELALWDAERVSGEVYLRFARFNIIHADPRIWPDSVRLTGLSYEALQPPLPAADRLQLLERDAAGFVPHAYEQLAAAYRRVGDDADARTVLLAKQRRHRMTLAWYAKTWGHLQDATVGYGFRPTRAMGWLLALLAVGTTAYGLHHPRPTKPGEAPDFNPLFYALDLLLPIIDFGQESAFTPQGWYQWLSYVLIITGWILATTIIAGITRAVSRQ